MAFVKGDKRINRKGRAVGARDKKWAYIKTFWDLLQEVWPKLSDAEKARYAFEGFKLHFDRAMSRLPADQDESLVNAIAAQDRLKRLEENARRGIGPYSNQPGMENGTAQVSPPVSPV